MQNKVADEIESIIIEGLKKFFGNKVDNIIICESTDIPYTMVGIEFEVYKYFNVRFNYDRGSFGCAIINGNHGIGIESDNEWFEKTDMDNYFEELKLKIELRIPDKFLKYNGWI